MQDLHAKGELNLKSIMQAGSTRVVDDDEEEEPSCSIADLHCSRKEANAHAGIKDIHGVVGAACDHGCPVYNSFMDIPSPEQFIYYLILLKILASFAILRDVYVDFGCRLNSTWKKFVFLYHITCGFRIIVNWMHVQSHEEKCRAVNSGLHHINAAWSGEFAEQMWAMTRVRSLLSQHHSVVAIGLLDYLVAFQMCLF